MKKIRLILPVLFITATLSSCLNNNNSDYPTLIALTTVHVSDKAPAGYYFTTDKDETIYPGDTSRIGSYNTKDKDRKRALVYFDILDQTLEGFDCNAAIHSIYDILTKEVEKAETEEQIKTFGNDPINIENIWISGGYLNIYYCLPTNGANTSKHRLSLVDNKTVTPPADLPAGYTYLEFRHNADGDTAGRLGFDYVSFKLGEYNPAVASTKGLYLKITSLLGSTSYIKIEPVKNE